MFQHKRIQDPTVSSTFESDGNKKVNTDGCTTRALQSNKVTSSNSGRAGGREAKTTDSNLQGFQGCCTCILSFVC